MQVNNINQLKREVRDTYKKNEKIATNFEAVIVENVLKKGYLDEKLFKIKGHLSLLEKNYNQFKLQYNKQSVEEILFQRAVKTTSQILYDRGHFDGFPKVDRVIKDFFLLQGVDLI